MIPAQSTSSKAKLSLSLALNLAVAVLSAVGTALSFNAHGLGMFQFYTVDSNVFAMLACLVYAGFLIRQLAGGRRPPVWAVMTKYASVCCLGVTFLVVVTILAPFSGPHGYRMMLLYNDMLYHHLFCPVLAALSFFLFDRVPFRAARAARLALLPTALYAAVIVVLNLARVIVGPYPFLKVYQQPVYASVLWVVLILGGAYAIAWALARLRRGAD